MDKVVFMLYALAGSYKDLHYHAKSLEFWGLHKEADDGFNGLYDQIDEIQEVCYLGAEKEAISAKEIFDKSRQYVPEYPKDIKVHFENVKKLLNDLQKEILSLKGTMSDGEENLLMTIQQRLQQLNGFLWRTILTLDESDDS